MNTIHDNGTPINGMGETPGDKIVIIHNPQYSTWGHEFGHNRGLMHVDDDSTNIMYGYGGGQAVRADQQSAFARVVQ